MSVHQSSDSTPLLSVVVITRNEADRIGRLLASVTFADEVVVVDSGSTDDTVRICRAAGAKVVHRDWQGYA
jgi:(heptosyl)LPS beta-1,4-glucosyltransferase